MPDLRADAALAVDLVREAAALAARTRSGGLEVTRKTSGSDIVTQADTAAERLVVERLAAERPEDAIMGEEGTVRPGTSGRTWVIDPVDGTYNFARGSDWWCTALALHDEDDVLLGAVHHPASLRTWVGGPDLPSTCDGVPLAPLPDTPREARCAVTYLHPPLWTGEVGDAFARALGEVGTLRMLGSGTMDCTAIAAGQWDVLFQHSVADWDRLPGAAIVRGAGGDSVVVSAGGVDWTVTGAPAAVSDVSAALLARG
ncbi:fructose-1,6-bisphosphatase/inositol monophosphatase family enzyme [Nocardioides cavernae]|uniref:Fructose-1,6-bisphosphatase/inositol monophosphatase family enzyme n=1 Tax=Nocardioides cavernae TaxID=1921566 RepID=A0A7Y9H5Q7_9ACTN|nr:inositol monophosphatase [Nocardioides cavernae]NYE38415.1 fructose-1,6-bisphosphatase/inositol monophosphatase family enzyme [Nocardioides cavernae]